MTEHDFSYAIMDDYPIRVTYKNHKLRIGFHSRGDDLTVLLSFSQVFDLVDRILQELLEGLAWFKFPKNNRQNFVRMLETRVQREREVE